MINVPVIFLQGDNNGASLPELSLNKGHLFTSHYQRRIVQGATHFIQREKPGEVIQAIDNIFTIHKTK